MPGEVTRDGRAVRRAVGVRELHHLLVAVFGSIADRTHRRPRHPTVGAHRGDRSRLHVDRDHSLRNELGQAVGIDDEVVGGDDRAPGHRTVDRCGPVLLSGRTVDDDFGNHEITDADGRAHSAGNANYQHAVEVSETEQAFGRAAVARAVPIPVVVATMSAFPTAPL